MNTFHKEISEIKKSMDRYSKKNYKYNTKTIEKEINQLRYDLDKIVEVIGCIADGYTELYILMMKIVERLKNGGT
jgi:uncharacterized coiled-coil DUF342 family protein